MVGTWGVPGRGGWAAEVGVLVTDIAGIGVPVTEVAGIEVPGTNVGHILVWCLPRHLAQRPVDLQFRLR